MVRELPSVTVRMSGRLYRLDDIMKYIKKNNLYQASVYIVNNTGMQKSYATKLAMAIRDTWQAGYNPVQLSCSLVGTTRENAKFTVRLDETAVAETRRRKVADERAAKEAREKAEKEAKLSALSEEEKLLLRIREVNKLVTDELITDKLNNVDRIIVKILARVEQKPSARREVEDFYSEYLPKAVQISESYARIYATGIENEDTEALKLELANSLQTCYEAFYRIYERTYDDDVLNLSTEIAALNSKLNYDGLTKSDFDISE